LKKATNPIDIIIEILSAWERQLRLAGSIRHKEVGIKFVT